MSSKPCATSTGVSVLGFVPTGSTLGKTILPSTSRTTVTAKIQPNMAATQPNQGPRLNIPTVVPKQKPRSRLTNKSAGPSAAGGAAAAPSAATSVASSSPVPVAIPVVLSSGAGALPGKGVAAASVGTSASSSPSKPGTPVSVAAVMASAPATPTTVSQSDSEVGEGCSVERNKAQSTHAKSARKGVG